MATPSLSWFCFVILLCSAAAEALEGGFSVELIHHDSPKSPFYDPSGTPFQRVGKAVRRSIARVRGLRSNDEGEPSADITRIDGDYLINITIGTRRRHLCSILERLARTRKSIVILTCAMSSTGPIALAKVRHASTQYHTVTSRTR
ncbi:hypothetical protein MLD38_037394 [Melastoma candidum]|uniref:Uncharacterized protein n=1 Tax=Melastoma candidum TaxID=119954 RepID=A0ACB9LPF8_9MYRT|nr:hypothetical protein MLD38_037394 [Melastoma candidum]